MRVCWRAPTCVNKTIEPDMHARRQRNHSILHNYKWMCPHACVNECLRVPSNVHKPLWGRTLICAHVMNITHARARENKPDMLRRTYTKPRTQQHMLAITRVRIRTRALNKLKHTDIYTDCMQTHIMTSSST